LSTLLFGLARLVCSDIIAEESEAGAWISMTDDLEKAVAQAKALSEEQQDAIAALIVDEIEDETRWDTAFAQSPDLLERLAAEATETERLGLAEELDPEAL
jgi:hypothetical protein